MLGSAPEREFDALAQAAALVCGVPISLISLIDENRQWFKANVGLSAVDETSRDLAFCAHAIHGDGIMEVEDASLDPRFSDNPLVTGNPDIRFYAGATLRLSDGAHVGTLCVIDRQPRRLDATQREVLGYLAAAAVKALEGRRALRAERQMRDTASQAAAVLRNSVDAIIALSLDGIVTHWNGAAERLFGYDVVEMLGRTMDCVVPESRRHEDHELSESLRGRREGITYETVRQHRNGEPIDVSVSFAPIIDLDGQISGATEIVRDIRERVRAEQVLAESEARFRALSDSSPLGVYATDAQGACTYTNARWQTIFGLTHEQSVGHGWTTTLHPDDRESVFTEWQRTAAARVGFDMEFRIHRGSGEVRHVRSRAQAIVGSDGVVSGHVGSVEDVTGRVRAERALSQERVRLSSILDGTGAGTWEWNVQTGETRINEKWAHIIGYTLDELEPTTIETWIDKVHPDDKGRSDKVLNRHLAGEAATYECEARMRHKDGHWVWVQGRGRVLTWTADGRPELMFGTHLDVTARKSQEEALQRSEQLLNRTGDVAGVGGWEVDLETGIVLWTDQTRRIHGVGPDYRPTLEEAIDFYAPEARPVIQAAVEKAMATGEGWDVELPFIQVSGARIWVRAVGTVEFHGSKPIRLRGAFQDVTQLRKLSAELAEQHELLQVTMKSIGDAVITTDAAGRVTWLNPVAERMTGWLNTEATGRALTQVFHIVNEATRDEVAQSAATIPQQGRVVGLANQTLLISREGAEYGIEESSSPIRNERGELLGVVLVFHDVTEQRRMTGEMSYRATHDALTGLVNRSEFETRLRRTLQKAQDERSAHALMYIDLDQFKLVNDACGHSVGDQLLQQVGRLLTETVRERDTLARLGGDEFAVILEHCTMSQAQRVAQQICDRMDDFRFTHGGRRFRIGASVGLVPIDNRWGTTGAVLQAADTSCYAAKEAGRNRVHAWFDTDQAVRVRHGEMQWASRLEQALDENRFVLYAQHIEPLHGDKHGVHAEVLLRLIDSDGSLVLPGAFLPAAESFHLATRIDRWVLRHAIAQLIAVGDVSPIDMLCINLSGQSIGDRAFHRQALETLTDAGPEICRRICLEITETTAVTNLSDAALFIEHARALGVRIALDDFGAGASSFSHLKSLVVDFLKIDGQYITDLVDDRLDDAAVRCFVDVARVVGVKTVAEFVDRPEILARVREIGIDYAQGFFLHRPEPLGRVLGVASRERVVHT
ncbi:MAG: PAS domain S-box protein [Gemmatimonadaceae bacterium]|nr:PAS domain S-box protein [Gemmatimonadaceae bacterium]